MTMADSVKTVEQVCRDGIDARQLAERSGLDEQRVVAIVPGWRPVSPAMAIARPGLRAVARPFSTPSSPGGIDSSRRKATAGSLRGQLRSLGCWGMDHTEVTAQRWPGATPEGRRAEIRGQVRRRGLARRCHATPATPLFSSGQFPAGDPCLIPGGPGGSLSRLRPGQCFDLLSWSAAGVRFACVRCCVFGLF